MTIFTRVLPMVSFVIGSSALLFQITVLYPWHLQLDDQFRKLKDDQQKQLDLYHKTKIQKLDEIQIKIDVLTKLVNDLKQQTVKQLV